MQSSFDLDPSQMNSSFMLGRKICDNPVEVLEDAEAAHPAIRAMLALRLVSSSLSIVGTSSIIFISLISGQMTNSDVHPIFMLSVADFLVAVLWLISAVIIMVNPSYIQFCYFSGLLTTCAVLVSFLLTATYAIIACLTMRELYNNRGIVLPLKDKRKRPRYMLTIMLYIVSWVTPFVILVPLITVMVKYKEPSTNCCSYCVADFAGLRSQFRNCTNGFSGRDITKRFDLWLSGAFLAVFLFTVAAMLVWYFWLVVYVRKVTKIYNSQIGFDGKDKSSVVEVLTRISLFIVIFFLAAIPTLAATCVVWNEQSAIEDYEQPDLGILVWQAIFAPLQGFLNSIVYGWTRRRFQRVFCSRSSAFYSICCRRRHLVTNRQPVHDYGSLHSSSDHEVVDSSPLI